MWLNVNLKINGFSWNTCKIRLHYRFNSFETCRPYDAIWDIKYFLESAAKPFLASKMRRSTTMVSSLVNMEGLPDLCKDGLRIFANAPSPFSRSF